MMIALYLVLSVLLLVVGNTQSAERQLVFAQSVFRHGDRAPSEPYPTDPYDDNYWPRGWSQLTNVRHSYALSVVTYNDVLLVCLQEGMRQTRALGHFFRHRYIKGMNFLSSDYLRDEVIISLVTREFVI